MLQQEIKNRTVFIRDNLEILRGMNSDTVDLIYLDPPFNTKKTRTSTIGKSSEEASFKDIFKEEDVKEEWEQTIKEDNSDLHYFLLGIHGNNYNYSYLCYMAIRLIEIQRILKDTGSLYLHCDPTMSHYLKIVLDYVFGEKNFRNEIVWCYNTQGKPKKGFAKKHDIIFFYAKDKSRFTFNKIAITPSDIGRYNKTEEKTGRKYQIDGKGYKYYLDDGRYCPDYWNIPALTNHSKERLKDKYPTQKPLALLDRIIRASTNEGDVVLDPFCGCGTTCVASEKLSRQWVGIDINDMAKKLVNNRLKTEQAVEGNYIPVRTDKKNISNK